MTSQEHNIHTTNNIHNSVVILAHTQGWQPVKRTHTSAMLHSLFHEGKKVCSWPVQTQNSYSQMTGTCPQNTCISEGRVMFWLSYMQAQRIKFHFITMKSLKEINLSITTLKFLFWRNIHDDFLYRWLQMAGKPNHFQAKPIVVICLFVLPNSSDHKKY